MWLLGYSEWLLGFYYTVARVLSVVSRSLLNGCEDDQCAFKGICTQLLGCSLWILGICYAVAWVFWVVARVLLCAC